MEHININDITVETQYYINDKKVTAKEYCEAYNTHYYTEQRGPHIYKLIFSEETKKNTLRAKRQNIFKAFDIYKQNVNYGSIVETEEEHQLVLDWYNDMLDIEKTELALASIPEGVKKYLGGN